MSASCSFICCTQQIPSTLIALCNCNCLLENNINIVAISPDENSWGGFLKTQLGLFTSKTNSVVGWVNKALAGKKHRQLRIKKGGKKMFYSILNHKTQDKGKLLQTGIAWAEHFFYIHIIYIIKLYQLKHSNPISDNCTLRSNKVSSPHSRSMILLYTLHILISAVHFYKSWYTHYTITAFQTASYRNSLGMSLTCTYSLWLYFFWAQRMQNETKNLFSWTKLRTI